MLSHSTVDCTFGPNWICHNAALDPLLRTDSTIHLSTEDREGRPVNRPLADRHSGLRRCPQMLDLKEARGRPEVPFMGG